MVHGLNLMVGAPETQSELGNSFLSLKLNSFNKESPKYSKVTTKVSVEFGYFFWNMKQSVMVRVLA